MNIRKLHIVIKTFNSFLIYQLYNKYSYTYMYMYIYYVFILFTFYNLFILDLVFPCYAPRSPARLMRGFRYCHIWTTRSFPHKTNEASVRQACCKLHSDRLISICDWLVLLSSPIVMLRRSRIRHH